MIGQICRSVCWAAVLTGAVCGCATWGGGEAAVLRAKTRVAPALVHIKPVKEVYLGGKREEFLAVGSGFVISPEGYVVTNEHVAGEASSVRCVLSNKEEVEAKVVGTDPYTDVAVLKLEGDGPYPCATLGHSGRLEAGQMVLALGSPHGLARSVSLGIVSVTDRYLGESGAMTAPYNNWIQTDAAINPGNSGGPLVNLKGEVVGINARVLQGAENVGFAIPIDTAREVIDAILDHGRVIRGWIGAEFQEMTRKTEAVDAQGVVIAYVDPLGPGFEAGLRPGDVLLAVNGEPTNARFAEDLPAVRKQIADLTVGTTAELAVARAGKTEQCHVAVEEKSDLRGDEIELAEWGFTVAELTLPMVRRAQLDSRDGVAVSGVQVGGLAQVAGLRGGDIILAFDEEPVRQLADFVRRYREVVAAEKRLVMLLVKRGALTRFVLVKQGSDVMLQQEVVDQDVE